MNSINVVGIEFKYNIEARELYTWIRAKNSINSDVQRLQLETEHNVNIDSLSEHIDMKIRIIENVISEV